MSNSTSTFVKFLFVFFLTICCAFLGMVLSKYFIPKSAGLAGGVMVLGYGLLGLFIGLVLGFLLKNKLSKSILNTLTALLVILGLGCSAWFYNKFRETQIQSQQGVAEMKEFQKTNQPTAQAQPLSVTQDAPPYGYGIAKPHLTGNTVFYFYISPGAVSASDSFHFIKTSYGDVIIVDMPAWLKPANIKLDYQIFNFQAFSQSNNRVQVLVNDNTGKKYWVNRDQVHVLPWSIFLIDVFAVEPLDWKVNPVKMKPSNSSTNVKGLNEHTVLSPLDILNEWMEVAIMDENYKEKGRGWIRWRTEDKLIIEYSLLS